MVEGKLYIRGFSTLLLRCVDEFEKERIMQEIHEGICGSHIGGRSLAMKVLRASFFWPTLKGDYAEYKKCDRC